MELPETVEVGGGASPVGSVIWLHGLGADGHDFEPVVPELGLAGVLGQGCWLSRAVGRPKGWGRVLDGCDRFARRFGLQLLGHPYQFAVRSDNPESLEDRDEVHFDVRLSEMSSLDGS